jgi:hypothetical protein
MHRNELEKFIKDLLMTWQLRDAEKLAGMYRKDVVGYMDDKIVNYDDIMNRLQFSKKNFKEVDNEIKDLIIEGEKIVARIKQTLIPREDGKPTVYHIISIYRVLNQQVVETWSSFYPNVNYLKND